MANEAFISSCSFVGCGRKCVSLTVLLDHFTSCFAFGWLSPVMISADRDYLTLAAIFSAYTFRQNESSVHVLSCLFFSRNS